MIPSDASTNHTPAAAPANQKTYSSRRKNGCRRPLRPLACRKNECRGFPIVFNSKEKSDWCPHHPGTSPSTQVLRTPCSAGRSPRSPAAVFHCAFYDRSASRKAKAAPSNPKLTSPNNGSKLAVCGSGRACAGLDCGAASVLRGAGFGLTAGAGVGAGVGSDCDCAVDGAGVGAGCGVTGSEDCSSFFAV